MSKNLIQLNEEAVKGELKDLVRKSVEETLTDLLNKEADELTSAARYERTEARQGYRSGHYSRKFTTTSICGLASWIYSRVSLTLRIMLPMPPHMMSLIPIMKMTVFGG